MIFNGNFNNNNDDNHTINHNNINNHPHNNYNNNNNANQRVECSRCYVSNMFMLILTHRDIGPMVAFQAYHHQPCRRYDTIRYETKRRTPNEHNLSESLGKNITLYNFISFRFTCKS